MKFTKQKISKRVGWRDSEKRGGLGEGTGGEVGGGGADRHADSQTLRTSCQPVIPRSLKRER